MGTVLVGEVVKLLNTSFIVCDCPVGVGGLGLHPLEERFRVWGKEVERRGRREEGEEREGGGRQREWGGRRGGEAKEGGVEEERGRRDHVRSYAGNVLQDQDTEILVKSMRGVA